MFHFLRRKSVRVLLVHSHPLGRLGGAEISLAHHVRRAPPPFHVDVALPDDDRPLSAYHVIILANLRPEGGLGEAAEFAWAVRWTERLRDFQGVSIRSERDVHPCGRRDAQCLVGPLLTRVPCQCGDRITRAFEQLYNACSAVQFLSPAHQQVIRKLIDIQRPQFVIASPRPLRRFRNVTPFEQRRKAALIIGDAVRAAPTAEDRARQAGFQPERFPYLSVPYAQMPELYNQYQAVVVDPIMFHASGTVAVEAMACGCRVLASERVGAISWPDPIAAVRQANRQFWAMVTTLHRNNPKRQVSRFFRRSYYRQLWSEQLGRS